MITVILSGGNGSRLWPLSRGQYPKQFLSLLTDKTLLQETLLRLDTKATGSIIVCNEAHRFIVTEQLAQIDIEAESILLEPFGRNTSPAVALTAMMLLEQGRDETLVVLPADHFIQDKTRFHQALAVAEQVAEQGKLVLFGIKADKPETGFGYIKCHQATDKGSPALNVEQFIEKPDATTAQSFIEQGNYYWNSGMFVFKCSSYLEELQQYAPAIYEACKQTLQASQYKDQFLYIDAKAFAQCPDDSIDYSVMEKTQKATLIPLDSGWNDIGAWSSLWEIGNKDKQGNVSYGDVILKDSKNNLAFSSKRLVTLLGVENLLVVETPDAVLVAHRDNAQSIKELVTQLKLAKRPESETNNLVYRPWGCYETIDYGNRFQVKRITVNPGATLSLQMHHHRAEHWVIVTGTALITCDDKEFILSENQSTYIPITSIHRLSNPGHIPLEVIEIQSGSYLGEDDIQRFEDRYGRLNVVSTTKERLVNER